MFHKVLSYPGHVLHHLLPPVSSISQTYSLRSRAHDRVLHEHSTRLIDCNFIIRLLYEEVYRHLPHITYCILFLCCTFLDCFMFKCDLSIGQNKRIIIIMFITVVNISVITLLLPFFPSLKNSSVDNC